MLLIATRGNIALRDTSNGGGGGAESSLCSDDFEFNPFWFCGNKVIQTQPCVLIINDGQNQQLSQEKKFPSFYK